LKSTNYKWLTSSSKGTAKGQHFLLQLIPGVEAVEKPQYIAW